MRIIEKIGIGLLFAVGVVVFIWYISQADLEGVKYTFHPSQLLYFALLLGALLFYFILRSVRTRVLLRTGGMGISYLHMYMVSTSAMTFSLFSPAQSGDIVKLQFLKQTKQLRRRKMLAAFMVEKIADIIIIFVIAVIFLYTVGTETIGMNVNKIVIGVIAVMAAFIAAFYFLSDRIRSLQDTRAALQAVLEDPATVIWTAVLTIALWAVNGITWWIVARIMDIPLPVLPCMLTMCVATLIGSITFIPGAIGTLEISNHLILTRVWGLSTGSSHLFALSIRALTVVTFLLCLAHLIIYRKAEPPLGSHRV